MPRIEPMRIENANEEVKEIYQNLQKKMGKVINIFQNMGNSATVLKAFLDFNEAVQHTTLSPKLREKIALVVGETNHCQYCLSAHTTLARGAGLDEKEIQNARLGEAELPKDQAILEFTKRVVNARGHVSTQEVIHLKAVGVDDKELVEIILVIALNMFTNYFNLITDTQIDFPLAPELK